MSSASAPFVSVIVPVYNDARRLEACLAALAAQSYPAERFEVIVADNGSTDDVAGVVARHVRTRIVRETCPGSYAARNRAAAASRAEVLAFTDADCLPRSDWLERGVMALQAAGSSAAVGGAVHLFAQNPEHPSWVETYELALAFPQHRYVRDQHFAVTANLLVGRAAWQRTGPFDAELRSGGDQEWGQRAHSRGVRLVYAPEAIVEHPARRSWSELSRKRARLVQGAIARSSAKYPRWLATALVFGKACLPPVKRMLHQRPGPPGFAQAIAYRAKVLGVALSLQAYSAYQVLRLVRGAERER